MITVDLQTALPASSLVPFTCHRLSRPSILWKNSDRSLDIDLDAHSFCVPMPQEESADYRPQVRTYYADRYGGYGLSENGGSGRCGLLGGVQIKGIGRTPVVGAKTNFWHAHGGASSEEGVREALWGEICHVALPHGGIRAHGIIATGTNCPYDHAQEGHGTSQRVLILRQAALRPAHFMRAIFFQPQSQYVDGLVPDTKRTRAAVEVLPALFGQLFLQPFNATGEDMRRGLLMMVDRIASQVSASKVKRLVHGTLTCSNVCLDGAWVDYGTITTVSDYGRIAVSRGNPDVWNQTERLKQTFEDLAFYVQKYAEISDKEMLPSGQELHERFEQTLETALGWEYLKLLGIPQEWNDRIEPQWISELKACFNQIIKSGTRDPFYLSPKHVAEMPSVMGHYHLNSLLQRAATCFSAEEMDQSLASELESSPLRQRLCAIVGKIRHAVIERTNGSNKTQAQIILLMNALRLNTPFSELYRPNLDQAVSRCLNTGEPIDTFVSDLVGKAETFLADGTSQEINIGAMLAPSSEGRAVHLRWDSLQRSFNLNIQDIIRRLDPSRYSSTIMEAVEHYLLRTLNVSAL